MAIRKDVFDLLCLYEGAPLREAFKPTWFEPDGVTFKRPKGRLEYRTQVPDELEPAFDIGIGEGLLEQHILSDRMDAFVFITEKGRAEIALHRTDSPILSERLTAR